MKAARDRDDEFHDPARKNDTQVRTRTRLELWAEYLQSPVAALTRALECLVGSCLGLLKYGFAHRVFVSHRTFACVCRSSWIAVNVVCAKILQKMWDGPCWEGIWPFSGSVGSFRVLSLVFLILFICSTSIAARFLVTLLIIFFLSRLGRLP